MSDKVYTSNFTGAEIDEAVGKVINNEIGGEAIKEGSIPLSALADDVKGEFNGKYGLSGYCGTLGRDNKTVDTNAYFRSVVYIKYENWIANASIGTYSIHDLFPSSAPIPGNIVVYAKGEKLSLDLQEDSNYWDNLKVFSKLYEVPIPTPDWNATGGEPGCIANKPIEKEIANGIESDGILMYTTLTGSAYISIEGTERCHFTYTGEEQEITLDWPNIKISWNGVDNVTITNLSEEPIDVIKNYISVYEYYKRLPSSSIDDSVIKTFKQELSDTAKNQVKENLGISTPDWNAREGESGYIENRTHYETYVAKITEAGVYTLDYSEMAGNYNYRVKETGEIMELPTDGTEVVIKSGPKITISFQGYGSVLTVVDDSHYLSYAGPIYIGVKVTTLGSRYLPDTVIKTTPQTLTNNAKYQARLNIDAAPNYTTIFDLDLDELWGRLEDYRITHQDLCDVFRRSGSDFDLLFSYCWDDINPNMALRVRNSTWSYYDILPFSRARYNSEDFSNDDPFVEGAELIIFGDTAPDGSGEYFGGLVGIVFKWDFEVSKWIIGLYEI